MQFNRVTTSTKYADIGLRTLMTSKRAAVTAPLVAVFLLLAGCLGAAPLDTDGDDGDGTDPGATPTTTPNLNPGNDTTDPGNGTGGNNSTPPPGGNNTNGNQPGEPDPQPNATLPPPEWPAIGSATVRPGVQVIVEGSQCTSNFVFRSPTNGTIYLGVAAHCLGEQGIGDEANIRDINGQTAINGRIAYSSWIAVGFTPPAGSVGDFHAHDFALIEIPKDKEHLVHPAALHFGGPVAVADYDAVAPAHKVIVYGQSGLYPRPEQLNWQEGVVLFKGQDTTNGDTGHYVATSMPFLPVPGDSGSGLMTKDGKALGVLHTFGPCNFGICWNYSSIPHALSYMESRGWDVELQTWELLDDGLL